MSDLNGLRMQVRSFYDIQSLRINVGNKISASFHDKLGRDPSMSKEQMEKENQKLLKKIDEEFGRTVDGIVNVENKKRSRYLTALSISDRSLQKAIASGKFAENRLITSDVEWNFIMMYQGLLDQEKQAKKVIEKNLSKFDLWTQYLERVPGVGPNLAGIMLSYFDINKAVCLTQFWAYSGLDTVPSKDNPDKREGRGKYEHHLVDRTYTSHDGTEKKTRGLSYQPFLKSKMVKVLADSLIKQNEYYRQIYHDYKNRLKQRPDVQNNFVYKVSKGKIVKDANGNPVMVKEFPDARVTKMAIRYMVKMFLKNLWINWRHIESLEITPGYEESKLGMDTSSHVDPWGLVKTPQAK